MNKANDVLNKTQKMFDKQSMVGKVMQVLAGLVVVVIIYFVCLKVINADNVSGNDPTDMNIKRQVPIVDGYADSSQISFLAYNTVLPFANNSLPLNPSSNIKGGAQFTYSLWLNVGAQSENTRANMPIFLRGDAKKYTYNVTDDMTKITNTVTDYVSFCPLLQFGTNALDFVVRFNTTDNIQEQLYVANLQDVNDLYRKNLLSLYNGKWFLLTVTFEDNIPINDFENGLVVKFYINEQLYNSQTYSSMLKQNNGDFYLFPSGPVAGCMVSKMTYYNYALGTGDIQNIYNMGPSNHSTTLVTSSFISPLMLSDKNRLDIYNA